MEIRCHVSKRTLLGFIGPTYKYTHVSSVPFTKCACRIYTHMSSDCDRIPLNGLVLQSQMENFVQKILPVNRRSVILKSKMKLYSICTGMFEMESPVGNEFQKID